MSFTDSDLRELLEHDSDDGQYRGVTVADVQRRIGQIRRRRYRIAGSAVAAVLAMAVAVGFLPSALSQEMRADVLAAPGESVSADSGPDGFTPGHTLAQRTFRTAGVRERLAYTAAQSPMGLTVYCERPGHVFIWLNGVPVWNTVCGVTDGALMGEAQWWDRARTERAGKNTVEVLVVPQEVLKRTGVQGNHPVRWGLTPEETERVLAAATPVPLIWRVTVRENIYPAYGY